MLPTWHISEMDTLRTAINSNHTAMIELITDNLAKTWLKLISEHFAVWSAGYASVARLVWRDKYKDLCQPVIDVGGTKQLSVFLDKVKTLAEENSSRYPINDVLVVALDKSDADIIKCLLEHGGGPSYSCDQGFHASDMVFPLQLAVRQRNIAVAKVRLLV